MDFVEGSAVAPNVHADWSRLPHFEWASIGRFAEGLAILCAVATRGRQEHTEGARWLVVVGSRDDLVKWFRQIPLYSGDHCLQCYHWGGSYIVDMHIQMGRQSSADGAQRISLVAAAIVFEAVEMELERILADPSSEPKALWEALRAFASERRRCTGSNDTGLWFLGVMQNDLGFAALSTQVGDAWLAGASHSLICGPLCTRTGRQPRHSLLVRRRATAIYIALDCVCSRRGGKPPIELA